MELARVQTIELVPLTSSTAQTNIENSTRKTVGLRRLLKVLRQNMIFIFAVVVPTALVAIYFFFIAADRYVSQASFVVRNSPTGAAGELASALQGGGLINSPEDAYVVHEFMTSRDAMAKIEIGGALETLFRPEIADFFWRPINWFGRPLSVEKRYKLYLRFVNVSYNSTTGISTIKVEGFRPGDARRVAAILLDESERLLNNLNDRAAKNSITVAVDQVEAAKQRAVEAQNKLTEFRNREAIIDPTRFSSSILDTIGRLSLESAQLSAQLLELRRSSPGGPQVGQLSGRIVALNEQIEKERRHLGGADSSMAPKISEYERIVLERQFAEQAYSVALASLELARHEARKQRLFLERVTLPTLPDRPSFPYRLTWVLMTAGVLFLSFVIIRIFFLDTVSHTRR